MQPNVFFFGMIILTNLDFENKQRMTKLDVATRLFKIGSKFNHDELAMTAWTLIQVKSSKCHYSTICLPNEIRLGTIKRPSASFLK